MPIRSVRQFPRRGTVRMVRRVVERRERPGGYSESYTEVPAGTREVRYRVEIGDLQYMVQRAASNKSGSCTSGPVTVVIHPDDRRGKRKAQEAADAAEE